MAATGVGRLEITAFRRGTTLQGKRLSAQEREKLLEKYLPPTPISAPATPSRTSTRTSRKPRNGIVKKQLYMLVYTLMHAVFSVWFRFRHAWHGVIHRFFTLMYYHHRTPEIIQKDVRDLSQIPQHLSVILEFSEGDEDQGTAGLEGLVNDVCEIAAWCACAGIPYLSVYEETGVLKNYIPQTHESISRTLESYFGADRKPSLSLRAPHLPSFTPPRSQSPEYPEKSSSGPHITILLLSSSDGRDTMVDLTRTLAQMAQKDSLDPHHISSELIDAELSEAVSGEPDLLILFSPTVELKGYPPWQVRLTEIFHLPDNKGVNYQVFIRALHRYAKAQFKIGR